MFKKIWKGIKMIVDVKVEAMKLTLASAQNKVAVGLVLVGVGIGVVCAGGGLIASAYINVPA